MGKTILKGAAALFLVFCVGMTAIAVWRAFMQTSGDTVASLAITRDPARIYAVVSDPDAFADWSGWRRKDRSAVFTTHGTPEEPTICWTGKELGTGCFTRGPGDPQYRMLLFTLLPAVVRDGKPEPAPATGDSSPEGRQNEDMGAYRVAIDPAPRGAMVTLTFEEPKAPGVLARVVALLSYGENERRAAEMLAALKTHMRRTKA